MLQTQPLEIADFSGGITDNYIDCALNQYKEADNFIVVKNGTLGKLLTRYGSDFLDSDHPKLAGVTPTVAGLVSFKGNILAQSGKNISLKEASGWTVLTGPTGNSPLNEGDTSDPMVVTEWNDHLIISNKKFSNVTKIYIDENGDFQVRTAGLPALSTAPSASGTAGGNNYLYTVIRKHTYMVGTVEFEEVSDVLQLEVENVNAPDVNPINFTSIPVLSNGATLNYATSEIKVEFYRTENAGTVFYKVGEVTNGTTIFSDTMSDSALLNSTTIYTTGGVLGYTAPPLAKFVHVVGDVALYGYIKSGSQLLQDRVLMSVPGNPSGVPALFFHELGQEITGISSIDGTPIVFCKKSIYRIDGLFDELGEGDSQRNRISSIVGCVSHHSIIQVPGGLYFAGNDGFYFTDGFNVRKVSSSFNKRYAPYVENETQAARIYGAYDTIEQRIWWAVSSNAGLTEYNDKIFILDLNYGMSDSMCFTTASNGESFRPTAICFHNGNLIRGDSRGYVFEHDSDRRADRKVETSVAPEDWTLETIVYNYESSATSFGTNMVRKWVTRLSIAARNETNLHLQITSINDDRRGLADLSPVTFDGGNVLWGDPDLLWGTASTVWNADGMLSDIRHFPKNNLRCTLKQIKITNALGFVSNSDFFGLGTVDSVAKTITIDAPKEWATYARDYYIYFENDGYTEGFLVTERTAQTITVEDSQNMLVDGAQKWIMKGQIKNEVLSLLSYTLHYSPLGMTQKAYKATDSGRNA